MQSGLALISNAHRAFLVAFEVPRLLPSLRPDPGLTTIRPATYQENRET
jgi:hypothetical protein